MTDSLYNTTLWRLVRARALARDASRCTVARLLGGDCSAGPFHVHHIVPVADGGARFDLGNVGSVCQGHHPVWEALRTQLVRRLLAEREPVVCRHHHQSADARRLCEERMARQRERVSAAA